MMEDMSGHHHEHPHPGAASTNSRSYGRAFAFGIGLNLAFVGAEWLYGMKAGSLALMADAGHNLGDVLGLALAWTAYALARRKPCGTFTYGLGRASILAALFNALLLLLAVGAISWEALKRLAAPTPVATGTVMAVAAAGILVNGLTAFLFAKGRKEDLNLRGAFLHMALDALVSLGVVGAGFLVARTGWVRLDPLVSLLIGLLILGSTWGLLREALRLLLDGVPPGISLDAVRFHLLSDPRVLEVHDLHVWATSTTETALSAHIRVDAGSAPDPLLAHLAHELYHHFGIAHTTLQLEHGDPDHPCGVGH
jgi:cobalt-zinc-cadmium efflux system protein